MSTVLSWTYGIDISGANAAVGEVVAPKTFFAGAPPVKTGTMANVTLAHASNAYPTGYHAGAASLTAIDPFLNSFNILFGVTIFGVDGIADHFTPYFGAILSLAQSAIKNTTRSHTKPLAMPMTSPYVDVIGDDPAHMIKLMSPAITLPRSAVKNTARTYLQPEAGVIGCTFTTSVA